MNDGDIHPQTAIHVLVASGIRVEVSGDEVTVCGEPEESPEVFVWKSTTTLGSKTIEYLSRKYGIAQSKFLDAERKAS